MSTSGRHGQQLVDDGIHGFVAFEYADAAARTAATGFQTYDLHKVAHQQDDDSYWVLTDTVTPTWTQLSSGAVITDHRYIALFANRGTIATGIYLQTHNNLPTNVTPIILPFDTRLIAMSASGASSDTWTAEVHLGGSLVSGATLSVVAATSAYRNDLAIDFNAGDGVQIYCNGSGINRPNVGAVFRRR